MTKKQTNAATPVEPAVQPTPVQPVPVAPEAPAPQPVQAAPVEPVAQPAPAPQPVQTPVANTVPTPTPPINPATAAGTTPNAFASIVAKLSTLGVGPIVTIAVVAVLLVGGVILGTVSSTPKSVFKGAINKVYKLSNTALDSYETYLEEYDLTENAAHITGDFAIETNLEDFDGYELDKISLGFDIGVDYKSEILKVGADLKGKKEKISFDAAYQKDEMYIASSLFEEILKIDSEMMSELGIEVDFNELKEQIKTYEKEYDSDPETYEYIVKSIKDALIKALDSEYMEKEKDTIDVLDKELRVTKNSYVFKDKSVKAMLKTVAEELLDDKDFAKKMADAMGVEKSDVKELLKQIKKSASDIDFDEKLAFNIYTKGLFNSLAGIGLEVEGKEYISMYTDGKNVEITFDNHEKDEYSAQKLVITIEKDGKGYKAKVKENKEKILEMNIKEATDETIDMTMTAYEEGEKAASIGIYLNVVQKKNTFSGSYKFKVTEGESKEYVGFSGKYTIAIEKELDEMKVKNAVSIEELDTEKVSANIEKVMEKDEALGAILKDTIEELEEEMLDLNYIGMSEVNVDKAKKLLTNTKATVLYVGDTYYSSYSNPDASKLLYNLESLQTELDFYSYYLDEYDVTTEFEELIKGPETNCGVLTPETNTETTPSTDTPTTETPVTDTPTTDTQTQVEGEQTQTKDENVVGEGTTTNCVPKPIVYPGIYLIKDGKIQKAITGTITYDELKTALASIGIE